MPDNDFKSDWVDRYLRDELNEQDEMAFEARLRADVQLQRELEAALAIREALKQNRQWELGDVKSPGIRPLASSWTVFAMAASILLAVVSTSLFWRASVETGELKQQISALQQPRTGVLRVPVNIMRSAGSATPDVIIQKPVGRSVIVLDIELSERFYELDLIEFSLHKEGEEPVIAWSSSPSPDGRASVVLHSESIPDGRLILQMTGAGGRLNENRLLEFRPARK